MIKVTIATAVPLSAAQLSKIKKAVDQKYPKPIEYKQVVDQDVIGGIRLVVGSKELDATLKGKLEQLKQEVMSKV